MERLTKRCKVGLCGSNNKVTLFPLFRIGSNNMYSDKGLIQECFNKLAEYEDLEEQNLLLVLPCKVGDIIYTTNWTQTLIFPNIVTGFIVLQDLLYIKTFDGREINYNGNIGTHLFLTHEQAEQKLKELQEGERE